LPQNIKHAGTSHAAAHGANWNSERTFRTLVLRGLARGRTEVFWTIITWNLFELNQALTIGSIQVPDTRIF